MKVTARSSTSLVIRDTSALARTMGAFCFLFGALFVAIASQGSLSLWEHTVPAVIGVLLAIAGLLSLLLPSTQTFVFDKAQRLLVITREAAFRRPVRESVELKDITAIELERSGDGELGACFASRGATTACAVRDVVLPVGRHPERAIVDTCATSPARVPGADEHRVHLVASSALRSAARRHGCRRRHRDLSAFLAIGTRLLWLQEFSSRATSPSR